MNPRVVLTWSEVKMAVTVGVTRKISSAIDGKKDVNGFDGPGWDENIEGAIAELVFAKYANVHWEGSVGTYKEGGDVGPLQVRWASKEHYGLLVRPRDRTEDTFILVTGTCPVYTVRGWMYGVEAKSPRFLRAPVGRPPAWFVPQRELRDLKDLPMPEFV